MKKTELRKELMEIINSMTDLETEMARVSFYDKGANENKIADWVNRYSKLSSRLDKVWKSLK